MVGGGLLSRGDGRGGGTEVGKAREPGFGKDPGDERDICEGILASSHPLNQHI